VFDIRALRRISGPKRKEGTLRLQKTAEWGTS
jgi:hypothetical protein